MPNKGHLVRRANQHTLAIWPQVLDDNTEGDKKILLLIPSIPTRGIEPRAIA